MNDAHYFEVAFLPWMIFGRDLAVGPVRIWDWGRRSGAEISEGAIAAHLARYFQSYVNHDGRPVVSLSICSYEATDLRVWTAAERRDVRRAVDSLVFATIAPQIKVAVCARNWSMGPPSADVFELVYQRFRLGDDGVAVRAGGALSGGWRIGEIQFPRPWATGGALGMPDGELLDGLGRVMMSDTVVSERIFRSLEWYRMANVENEHVSDLSRVLMLATGLEVLLEFPRQSKRRYFVDFVEDRIAERGARRGTRVHENGQTFTLSLAGCWAWDFYELRSRIVHGDVVNPADLVVDDWVSHLIIANMMFLLCVEDRLFELRFLGDDLRREAEEFRRDLKAQDPLADWERQMERLHFDFARVHRALKWID